MTCLRCFRYTIVALILCPFLLVRAALPAPPVSSEDGVIPQAPALPHTAPSTQTTMDTAPKKLLDFSNLKKTRMKVQSVRAPSTPKKTHDMQERAFIDMSSNLLPLSTDQVNRLHALYNETQRAANQQPGVPARPTSSSLLVDLAPGSAPPVVRLGTGYVSSIVFLDASGAPWPIQAYDIGNPTAYGVKWDKKSNILMVQSMSIAKRANMIVLLKGLNTPISLTLMSDQKAIDYRIDLRVPGLGPNARASYQHMPASASSALVKVLDGIPPMGAKRLTIEGGDAQAWLFHEHILLRTGMTVLSPAWMTTMVGPDDSIHVYQLPKVAIILAAMQGKMVALHVKGL